MNIKEDLKVINIRYKASLSIQCQLVNHAKISLVQLQDGKIINKVNQRIMLYYLVLASMDMLQEMKGVIIPGSKEVTICYLQNIE